MHVSWRSLSRVVRDGCFHRVRRRANPMIHHRKYRPEWARWPTFRVSDECMSRRAPQHAATNSLLRITERLEGRVKGLTSVFPVLLLTIRPATRCLSGDLRGVAVGQEILDGGGKHEFSRGWRPDGASSGRNHVGDRRTRHQGAEGIRQSAGCPWFHSALSNGGRSACPPWRVPVWTSWNADHPGSSGGIDGS